MFKYLHKCTPYTNNLILLSSISPYMKRSNKSLNNVFYLDQHYLYIKKSGNKMKKYWYKNGKLDREKKPAVIKYNIFYMEISYHEKNFYRTKPSKVLYCKKWYNSGKLHRVDGPAFIVIDHGIDEFNDPYKSTIKEWYYFGKLHRDGGPSSSLIINDKIVYQQWYIDNKLHRDDGPAIVCVNNPTDWFSGNYRYWYKNGVFIKKLEDNRAIFSYDSEKEYDEIHHKWFEQ